MTETRLEMKSNLKARAQHPATRLVRYTRDLIAVLVWRDLKVHYKRSVLGFAWSLLNPLLQMLVFSFVFRYVLPLDIPNYPVFLFIGLLPWSWFSGSLQQATDAIVGNRELVRRPGFPPAVLPLVTVLSHMVHFVLALPILGVFLFLGDIPLSPAAALLPVVIVLQLLLTLSLAYLAAAIHVTFRDTQYLLGILLLLGFYLTPVLYDADFIPARYRALYALNPMFHLIDAYRKILLHGQLPDLESLAFVGAATLVLIALGFRFFRRASAQFVEEL